MSDILFALSITLFLEPFLVSVFFRFDKKAFVISYLSNIVLNPTMNLILGQISREYYYMSLTLFEIATILIEAIILFFLLKRKAIRSFLAALCANAVSLGVGIAINQLGIDYHAQFILTNVLLCIDVIALSIYFALLFLDMAKKKDGRNDDAGAGKGKPDDNEDEENGLGDSL